MTIKRFKRRNADGVKVKVTQFWKNAKHLAAQAVLEDAKAEIHRLEERLKELLPKSQRGIVEEDCAHARGAICTLVNRKVWDALDDPKLPLLVMYDEQVDGDDDDEGDALAEVDA